MVIHYKVVETIFLSNRAKGVISSTEGLSAYDRLRVYAFNKLTTESY